MPWGWPCEHMKAAEEAAQAPQTETLFTSDRAQAVASESEPS